MTVLDAQVVKWAAQGIVAVLEREPGYVMADIDPQQVTEIRKRLPVLTHEREYKL